MEQDDEELVYGPQIEDAYTSGTILHGVAIDGEFAQQARRMPKVVRQLLVDGIEPSEESADSLLEALRLHGVTYTHARLGLDSKAEIAILRSTNALNSDACARLRAAVDHERQTRSDSVDGSPDHQLNLSREALESFIGSAPVAGLWKLAERFAPNANNLNDAEIFIRRYTADTRPWNPFHTDTAAVTVNVALIDDLLFEGGRLLACYEGAVRSLIRTEGEATVHASTLLHGVSMMRFGVRYSLIIFLGRPKEEQTEFTVEMHQADNDALGVLLADIGFLSRCRSVLGESHVAQMQESYKLLHMNADIGRTVESVVSIYGAPYLRPVCIRECKWKNDAACWSLFNLLNYASQERCIVPRGALPHVN